MFDTLEINMILASVIVTLVSLGRQTHTRARIIFISSVSNSILLMVPRVAPDSSRHALLKASTATLIVARSRYSVHVSLSGSSGSACVIVYKMLMRIRQSSISQVIKAFVP